MSSSTSDTALLTPIARSASRTESTTAVASSDARARPVRRSGSPPKARRILSKKPGRRWISSPRTWTAIVP
jgi:hypothetical protein